MSDHSAFEKYIRAYCFGHATESERDAVEIHLLECDYCWEEVQRLEASVKALDSQRDLIRSLSPYDLAAMLGISGKLQQFLGGHAWHVFISCALYGGIYVAALAMEVAYDFGKYGTSALKVAPLVWLWIFGTSVAGLGISWKLASRWKGLGLAALVFVLSAVVVLQAGISFILPDSSITLSSDPSLTAQGAYLKDTYYSVPLAIVFLLLPYHFVVSMQRDLKEGRYRYALEFLTGHKLRLAPKGTLYPPFKVLVAVLIAMLVVSVFLTNNLFAHITPGPHKTLFTSLVYVRLFLYYGLGLECLAWYYYTLNELKRECRAAEGARLADKEK